MRPDLAGPRTGARACPQGPADTIEVMPLPKLTPVTGLPPRATSPRPVTDRAWRDFFVRLGDGSLYNPRSAPVRPGRETTTCGASSAPAETVSR